MGAIASDLKGNGEMLASEYRVCSVTGKVLPKVVAIAGVVAALIFAFDLSTPLGVAGGVPYVMLVLLGIWFPKCSHLYILAATGTALTILGFFLSPAGGISWVVLANRGLALFAIWVTALLIAKAKQSDGVLRESEERFRSISESSTVAIIIAANQNGDIVTWNKAAEKTFGYSVEESLKLQLTNLMPERYRDPHRSGFRNAVETEQCNIIGKSVEVHGLKKNGDEFPIELSLGMWGKNGEKYFSAVIHDITERKNAERKIQQLAYTDPNTGMPNELAFLEKLHESIDQDRQGFVLSIELSGFGDIIGTFGLEALDLIIYELGCRLSNQMNDLSIAARVGETSFKVAYIADDIDEQAMKEIASRIFQIARQSFDLMGSEVFVNVHMGVNLIDVEKSMVNLMLSDVEIARYEAMKSVASCMVYFNKSIRDKLSRSTMVVSWLRSAIKDNVFELFFQPQVNLKTNAIVGCEALIRWRMGPDEWITPGEFIPIAEKAGLIGEITKWTVDEVCRTAVSWDSNQKLKIRVGVNISAEELASPNFLKYVLEFIEKTKLPPEFLEIEITETALMKDTAVATKNLRKLRKMGASIAIDDFGTGQASLAYLKYFPIDRLKIDQSFVLGALTNKTDRKIIVSVIKLAHSLDIEVIAEGAEEKGHIDMLTSLGCDEVQGYFIAKPMPADQFVEFVHAYS